MESNDVIIALWRKLHVTAAVCYSIWNTSCFYLPWLVAYNCFATFMGNGLKMLA